MRRTVRLWLAAAFCSCHTSTALALPPRDATCSAPSKLGCYLDPYKTPDGTMRRVLAQNVSAHDASMTVEKCIGLCCAAGYGEAALAGLARPPAHMHTVSASAVCQVYSKQLPALLILRAVINMNHALIMIDETYVSNPRAIGFEDS